MTDPRRVREIVNYRARNDALATLRETYRREYEILLFTYRKEWEQTLNTAATEETTSE